MPRAAVYGASLGVFVGGTLRYQHYCLARIRLFKKNNIIIRVKADARSQATALTLSAILIPRWISYEEQTVRSPQKFISLPI